MASNLSQSLGCDVREGGFVTVEYVLPPPTAIVTPKQRGIKTSRATS